MTQFLRSMLYVPANSWRMITNAAAEGADALILDLEDACPMEEKETGRVFARDAVPILKEQGVGVFVRVNALETGLTPTDLSYVVVLGLDGVVLAKTESGDDIRNIDALLEKEEQEKGIPSKAITLMALVETPRGILNLREIVAASERIVAVGFGAGDFSREMGAGMGVSKLSPEDYFPMVLYARSAMATTARAEGIQAIDTPFFGLVIDLEGLRKETERVKILGFSGKQVTHPRHVSVVNEAFTPPKEEVDFANDLVKAYEEAKAKGLGATTIGGKMVDYGSFKRAEALVSLAGAIKKKEKGQEIEK